MSGANFGNLPLLEELYEKYQDDPNSVDTSLQSYFDQLDLGAPSKEDQGELYRRFGHLEAKFNPIEIHPKAKTWQLPDDTRLRSIYCSNIGVEFSGDQNRELDLWLKEQMEGRINQLTIEQKKMILHHLNKSELFEVFLHTKYVGQKRFSLEGAETLIPLLASIVDTGSLMGVEDFILGMAHRGRLNVLCNILDKSYATIFSEFEEGYIPVSFEGSGDVKYHKGFQSSYETIHGKKVNIFLSPNPSHLESVDPVVEGVARAKQFKKNENKVVPILIHGDAALAGQGVVYETMQMYKLEGYSTGGTIHLVINNQIGFTTFPKDGRSTTYCTDLAKTFGAPVFHVNAEDPESCIFVTNLAVEIRQKFHCDVFIDLNCYRKYGHNESDEPAFTQPIEYKLIREKRPIREIYRDQLINQGVLEKQVAEALEEEFKNALQTEHTGIKVEKKAIIEVPTQKNQKPVSKELLNTLVTTLSAIPEGFTIHPKLMKVVEERKAMVVDGKPIDWGMGETLAYATILAEGTHIRLTGQDCCRGTFSHRHALFMDQVKEQGYFPLKNIGPFEIYNSPLTEYAGLGFEYGYSIAAPEALVIWEAQFGDFSNGAQVIIDQYIASGEQKWGQKNALVMFLPHGYEGQGPEHSSARMERFLTLSGHNNMRIVYPTTPSQMFHVLRRQVALAELKPLIIFTPKGLLRHPDCVSSIDDLINGTFEEVLNDPLNPKKAKHVILCTGRVFYDLQAERTERKIEDLSIIRIEQLYPLNTKKIEELLAGYEYATRFSWVQEEPKNMGAWSFIHPQFPHFEYIGREISASPAVGSYSLHKKQYAAMMELIFKEK